MADILRGFTAAPRRARVLGLPAVLLALSSSACGSSTHALDTVTVERAIANSILAQRQLYAMVSCPSDVPRKAGVVFTCEAHLDVGTYPVSVTETNNDGHVRYRNQTPLAVLDVAGVERAIRQSILSQRSLRSTVTCPPQVIQETGIAFTCVATVDGRRYPFAVTEVDGHGHVRYVGR
jgi:hypothetical protein